MAEFLLIKEADQKKDFSAKTYGWDGQTSIHTSNVKQMWPVASIHLVHFGQDRAPEDAGTLESSDTTFEGLRIISETVLNVMGDFVSYLEANKHPDAKFFRTNLSAAHSKHIQST